jgi:hypothetical protein
MIRILVDGITFQRGASSAALWLAVIARLAQRPELQISLLDRGGCPSQDQVVGLPFPAHVGSDGAADSLLIQRLCDRFAIDVFASTGNTSPVATPSVLFIPSLTMLESNDPEDQTSLAYAHRYVCASESILRRLLAQFPEVLASHVTVCVEEPASIASGLAGAAHQVCAEVRGGAYNAFFQEWKRIREIQAAVDWRAAQT